MDKNYTDIKKIQEVLERYQLKVNKDKTDRVHINIKNLRRMERSKKVGSLIGDNKDVERRKQQATVALYKPNNVWINGNKLKTSSKIKCIQTSREINTTL